MEIGGGIRIIAEHIRTKVELPRLQMDNNRNAKERTTLKCTRGKTSAISFYPRTCFLSYFHGDRDSVPPQAFTLSAAPFKGDYGAMQVHGFLRNRADPRSTLSVPRTGSIEFAFLSPDK
jgi:hypothetical protein